MNDKLLLISGSSDNSIFNITQEIMHSILLFFFNNYINKDNNNQNDILLNNAQLKINNFFYIIDELYGKRTMKLLKLKFPKVCYVNKKYIKQSSKSIINSNSSNNINNVNINNNININNININNISLNISNNKNIDNNSINISKTNFSIFILTYNVCGMNLENIMNINFSELLFPRKAKNYFDTMKKKYPIFYCIGLEEVINLNAKNVIIGGEKEKYILWEERIKTELKAKNNYVLLMKTKLVGIIFFLFVQASEVSKIENIKNTRTKTGFYGQLGNKGSCFVEFEYDNKKYGFNNGHLTAGETIKNNNERKNNVLKILNHQYDKNTEQFYKNDFYFILGDLNFRVKNSIKIIHQWLFNIKFQGKENEIDENNNYNDKNNYDKDKDEKDKDEKDNNNININIYKSNEENNNKDNKDNIDNKHTGTHSDIVALETSNKEDNEEEKNFENIFYQIDEKIFMKYFGNDYYKFDQLNIFKEELKQYDIKEDSINFPPTYKYIKKTNCYNLTKREPSWTDRILYKQNNFIKCIIYDRINIHYSDHKPVFAIFDINY